MIKDLCLSADSIIISCKKGLRMRIFTFFNNIRKGKQENNKECKKYYYPNLGPLKKDTVDFSTVKGTQGKNVSEENIKKAFPKISSFNKYNSFNESL